MAISSRTLIARLHRKKPTITAPEVVARFEKLGRKISRQRVYSLASLLGIELAPAIARAPKLPPCDICGKPLTHRATTTHAKCHYVKVKCTGCGIRFPMTRSRRARSPGPAYHSRGCFTSSPRRRRRRAAA